MHKLAHSISFILLACSAITLIALQLKLFGGILLLLGVIDTLFFCEKKFSKEIILIYISIGILGITPISTYIGIGHILIMGLFLLIVLAIPYVVLNYVYKDSSLHYKFHNGRKWHKKELLYIFLLLLIVYALFPFMLKDTGSYLNWDVKLNFGYMVVFFLGLNFIGSWDEFFFISTVFTILHKHLKFLPANIIQSIIFTSFLYELGFRSWAACAIFIFAFMQGVLYKKTNSLFYLITIHLSADFVLFLVLINAYYPSILPIFVLK